MCRRCQILMYAFSVLFWALPAAAQVEYDGLQMTMGGDVSTGYNGDLSNQGGSDHGLGLGGSGSLSGSYYNPNFLSFSVLPYYDRSQSNSGSGSIFDSSGYNGSVSLFQGSNFPGSISFGQVWDSTGSYGIPDVAGLTTKNNNSSFGIGWSERVPGLPTLAVSFARSSGSSSLLGSDAQSDVTTDSFGIHSAYMLRGFTLGAGFMHLTADTNSTGFVESGEAETTNTSTNSYEFNVGHALPLHGGFGVNFERTDYNSSYGGATSGTGNGTTDNAFGVVNLELWKLPIVATAAYTDNLYGSFEESILNNGGTLMSNSLSPESRSLLLNVSSSYLIMPHLAVNGYVSRQEMYLAGQSYGLTQLGASLNFYLGRRLKGLTVTVGMNDSADKQGNQGAGLVANANYNRSVGHWDFTANFSYNQNVQTMFAIYQTSSLNYGAQVHRRLPEGFSWTLGGGGGRTAFEQVAGNGSQGEAVNSSLSWNRCRCTLAGNYSQSNGTSVLTPTGLVPVPAPVVSNNLIAYNAQSHGFAFSATPMRAMTFSASYSEAQSNMVAQSLTSNSSNNDTELVTGMLSYRYRKLYFNAGVTQFRQSLSSSGALPSVVTSYYFGVSRWLKLF